MPSLSQLLEMADTLPVSGFASRRGYTDSVNYAVAHGLWISRNVEEQAFFVSHTDYTRIYMQMRKKFFQKEKDTHLIR